MLEVIIKNVFIPHCELTTTNRNRIQFPRTEMADDHILSLCQDGRPLERYVEFLELSFDPVFPICLIGSSHSSAPH